MSDTGSTRTLDDLIADEIEDALTQYEIRLGQIVASVREGLIERTDTHGLMQAATRTVHDRLIWVIWEGEL